MILLIDNYDSFTWNLVHYFGQLGATVEVYRNDQITVDEAMAKKPRAIVLSPGPCDPDKAGICLELVRRVGETTPILGVCLGHQTIGQVYGGKVVRAPAPMRRDLARARSWISAEMYSGTVKPPALPVPRSCAACIPPRPS